MTVEGRIVEAEWPEYGGAPKIAIVGEAPGAEEALAGKPFIGGAGRVLNSLLWQAGIERTECLVTNVFNVRPPENSVGYFFHKPKRGDKMAASRFPYTWSYTNKQLGYLRPEAEHHLERLRTELINSGCNIVIALGATPLWALTGLSGITKYRGTTTPSTLVEGLKVLPTFHPAYIMRGNWHERPTVGADLVKARMEAETKEIVRPEREIWIEPSYGDLLEFERKYMQNMEVLAYDIETDPWNTKQMRCIGFAPNKEVAIVVPFMDYRKPGWSYWPTLDAEVKAFMWVKERLEDPSYDKLAHNGLYDIQWLARDGIKVRGETRDTMILHHVLQPEMKKSLGFLGSVYTSEGSWKQLVSWAKKSNKKDII